MSAPARWRAPVLAAALFLLGCAARAGAAGPPALEPPPEAVLAEAQALVDAFEKDPRGPYTRLRWWCADGSIWPPKPYPCGELGGGRQHAEYSPGRARLAELGWPVGTIFAALEPAEFLDESNRRARLRALPIEKYLVDVLDGWVLRRALYYRGRVQVEDEEAAGSELLVALLADPELVRGEFLLARELVRAVPHRGGQADRTRELRRAAEDVAAAVPSFERLRVKIHGSPGPGDAEAVRSWASAATTTAGLDDAVLAAAERLASLLDATYGDQGATTRLAEAAARLARLPAAAELVMSLHGMGSGSAPSRLLRSATALRLTRERLESGLSGERALALLDLSLDLEAELLAAASTILDADTRPAGAGPADGEAVPDRPWRLSIGLLDGAFGAGLLSARERDALAAPAARVAVREVPVPGEALEAGRALERAPAWALGLVRHAFAEPLARFTALEQRAARFPDELLRSSAMLPLASLAGRLARRAEREAGLSHVVFGERAAGLAGLNTGVGVGRLRIVSAATGAVTPPLRPDEIVVLPETTSELTPVAGILTVAEGNALSHVQLLARNLGIPNAVIPPTVGPLLAAHDGEQVVLIVTSAGEVRLLTLASLPAMVQADFAKAPDPASLVRVTAPQPDLSVTRPIPLSELHAGLSGHIVGPKAANLGELARHFPGCVAPALALPFGVFAQHAEGGGAGAAAPRQRLVRAFEAFRAGTLAEAGLAAEVDAVRLGVEGLRLSAKTRAELEPLMAEMFGPAGTSGVFVRSDTNVEDLPGFTGAGLNRTVPHVVGRDAQLLAVPKVWASPFTERAMAWRRRALANPEEVYPSVLLMQSVPSDKSGVMVTADVVTGGEGVTVAMAWGVGGAVDGDAAETLVLRPDGSVVVASEAKAPWCRRLATAGGLEWVPARAGRVLTDAEIQRVRELAVEVRERLEPVLGEDGRVLPWDVEFGFAEGRLALFQVRPLVARGALAADALAARLDAPQSVLPPTPAAGPTTPGLPEMQP